MVYNPTQPDIEIITARNERERELTLEKRSLQNRIAEIDQTLDALHYHSHPSYYGLPSPDPSSTAATAPGKFDEFMQSAFAIAIGLGALLSIAMMIL